MKRILSLAAATAWAACVLSAHDLSTSVERAGPAVIVEVTYAGQEPADYSQVLIYSPADREVEHQNGRTDANGFFSFVPDRPGEWLLIVDDEEGHRLELPIEVDPDASSFGDGPVSSSSPTWQKLITGVSFIVGVTGLFFWWKARHALRQDARS